MQSSGFGQFCCPPITPSSGCLIKQPGECVFYTSPSISGTTIHTGDNLNDVVNKIIVYVNGQVSDPYTTSNGLILFNKDLRLGQTLGQTGNPAVFTETREIPIADKNLFITGTGNVIVGGTSATADNGNGLQVRRTIQTDTLSGPRNRVVVADVNGVLQTLNETTNGIFYVQKKYAGEGAAIFTGLTYADISSTNAQYTNQLEQARQGDINNPYPDPFAARNAALDAITNGDILTALIVVDGSDNWTIGSDNPDNNGDLDGVSTGHMVADIGFSSTNNTTVSSLLQNSLNYFFNPVSLLYINATYSISLGYISDSTDTLFTCSIYGFVTVKQIYGEVNGFLPTLLYIDNARANIIIEGGRLYLQQSTHCIYILNAKLLSLTVDTIISANSGIFFFGLRNGEGGTTRNGDGSDSVINIEINFLQSSSVDYPYPTNDDNWYCLYMGNMAQDRFKDISINIDSVYIKGITNGALMFFNSVPLGGGRKNLKMSVEFDNFHQVLEDGSTGGGPGDGLIFGPIGGIEGTNSLYFRINNCTIETSLLGGLSFQSPSNTGSIIVTVDIDNCARIESADVNNGIISISTPFSNVGNDSGDVTVKISGYYKNMSTTVPAITITSNANFPLLNKVLIKGEFVQKVALPVINILNGGVAKSDDLFVSTKDLTLVNDGTVACIDCEGDYAYTLFSQSTIMNAAPNAALLFIGNDPVTEAALIDYF
jgi:hypothetical protein